MGSEQGATLELPVIAQRVIFVDRKRFRISPAKRVRILLRGRRFGKTYGRSAVPKAAHDVEAPGMGKAVPAANVFVVRQFGKNDACDPSGNAGRRICPGIDAAILGGDAAPGPT